MARVACLFSGIIPRDLPCLGPGLWLSSPSREETGFAFTCRTILVPSLHMLTPFFLHCHPALPDPITSHMLGHFWPEASHNQPPLGKARSPQAFLKRLHVVSPISVRAVPPLGELPFSSAAELLGYTEKDTAAVWTTARAVCQGKSHSWSIHTAPSLTPQPCGLFEEVLR